MNMIEKIIDTQPITGPSHAPSDHVMITLPEFRIPPDSFLNSSSSGFFPENLFLFNSNLMSQAIHSSTAFNEMNSNYTFSTAHNGNADVDGEKSSEEDDFCGKCQKHFCNKYYLRKHKIDVHKTECDLTNPLDMNNVITNDFHKHSMFQPSIFNPLFNSSFSNFLFQKPIGPMLPNLLLPSTPSMSTITHQKPQFSLPSISNSSPVFSQTDFRISQPAALISNTEGLTNYSHNFSNKLLTTNENRLANKTISMFDEGKNFIKRPLESKSYKITNAVETGLQDQNKSLQSISCNICGIQLFGGEAVMLNHLFTCHSKENINNSSSGSNVLPTKDSVTSPLISTNDSYISPFDAFKSSMAAAKLADRVTCDICHKDLCNKYFLRTHKLKLHGVQTMDSIGRTGNRKEKNGFFERGNNQMDQLNLTPAFNGISFTRNLLPDPLLPPSLFTSSSKPRCRSPDPGCLCPICKRLISLSYFLPLHMWNAHGIGMNSHASLLPSACNSQTNLDPSLVETPFMSGPLETKLTQGIFPLPFSHNGLESNLGPKWYRKSPNQMRVRCDICDKWICNKYFLRTHKLNKHGLTDNCSNTDVNSDSFSRNFFIDATTLPNTSSAGTDPSDNQTNNINSTINNESSPIDLSASPIRNSQPFQCNMECTVSNPTKPNSVTSQSVSNFNLNSLWSTTINFPWSLRLPMDQFNIKSTVSHSSRICGPLDLSMKTEKIRRSKNDIESVEQDKNSFNNRSMLLTAAKRLKVKYQKIHRSRHFQNAFLRSRKGCNLIGRSRPMVGIMDYLNCPLCGKELNDAASFLQHLTQFHDMVLPGTHSNFVS